MTRSLFLLAATLMLSGCATTPQTFAFDKSRDVAAGFDKTWEGVISYFAENNIPIATVEKDSGLIVASDERVSVDTLKKLADCSVRHPATAQMSVNVFVRPTSASETSVQVNTRYSGTAVGLMNTTLQVDCNSNGSLEEALLDWIQSDVTP